METGKSKRLKMKWRNTFFWCSQSTTVLFRSIKPHQVLSEPWRRSICTSSRNNPIKELFHLIILSCCRNEPQIGWICKYIERCEGNSRTTSVSFLIFFSRLKLPVVVFFSWV